MTHLFTPLTLRGTTFTNRAWLAPMCQYSSRDGFPDDWHLVHLGARAAGGFGLLLTEASAVVPEGRISPQDAGLWSDEHAVAWRRVTDFVHARGTRIGVQLAHAGRKASTYRPFAPGSGSVPVPEGGWRTLGPSALAFDGLAAPAAMTADEVAAVPAAFAAAARRAVAAGFDVVEVHAAHGYLLHQFLSPLSNTRDDAWGGSLENRARLLVETVDAVRAVWPDDRPLLVRVSATDWTPGGLTVDDVASVARTLAARGVDLVDVSSGGNALASIPVEPGYQVPFARRVREVSGLPVAAVGVLDEPRLAEKVLAGGDADAVLLGRAALRDPSWPLRAAHELGVRLDSLPAGDDHGATVPLDAVTATGYQPQYARGAFR
ncbi:NADH:flavin oxidoreductase/NADH oxidase [Cellulomonas palmilytica]|uniref:NADH:flavin oxidoreductase/NADH oxidase n=1 Tax=Cellulomonas palmilytica TaxID=2608402 RepID=UPI001F491912|nr:NADH:flavin oxidoreductase/NADH oxidase [Cellulomonas palmilytica]